ncbi:unnamed protein product [Lampetra planeri]
MSFARAATVAPLPQLVQSRLGHRVASAGERARRGKGAEGKTPTEPGHASHRVTPRKANLHPAPEGDRSRARLYKKKEQLATLPTLRQKN